MTETKFGPGYFRVGSHCPWNIYRMTSEHPWSRYSRDERFAVAFNPEDGARIVAALNAAVDRGELPEPVPVEQTPIPVETVRRLDIKDGEVLMFTLPAETDPVTFNHFADAMKDILPHNKTIVTAGVQSMVVLNTRDADG